MRDLFLVKRDGRAARCVAPALSPYSFVVLVSDPTDFSGTHFLGTGQTMTPSRAGAHLSGREWHSAAPVTSGTRYVITGFVQRSATGAAHADRTCC